jgi:acetyl esterase/lipase
VCPLRGRGPLDLSAELQRRGPPDTVRHMESPLPIGSRTEIIERLDPMVAAFGEAITDYVLLRSPEDIAVVREQGLGVPVELSAAVERSDRDVPGDPPVRVRLHRPVGVEGPLPAIVSLHLGGYVVGSYENEDARHDSLCPKLGYLGVAVEYRLAPESPYPDALEDAYAALKWVHDNAEELGVDPSRIGILGASAGGGLAAALALYARDKGEVAVGFQQLLYPMLDDRRTTPTSGWDVPIWSPASNEVGWSSYLGDLYGTSDVPIYAAASRATDLSGLPPAFLCVGALDLFCDEVIDYAQRLNHAGVPVELHVYPGGPHAFDVFGDMVQLARRCLRDEEEWLATQLGRT